LIMAIILDPDGCITSIFLGLTFCSAPIKPPKTLPFS
jgi:hypothetical protein